MNSSDRLLWQLLDQSIPPKMRSFSDWIRTEIVLPSGPFPGERLDFNRQPFVRLWAEAVDSGRYRAHIATGCVQSGKSLSCFVAIVMYVLFELRENVIVGCPIGALFDTKWQEDILPVLEASSYADLLPRTGKGSQGGTPERIEFLNGVSLQFMTGGGSDKTRAGATARFVVVTETDGLDVVGGKSSEGTKISQLQGRTQAFADRGRHFFECTVSTDKAFTWREYQAGTASKIVCECPHCGGGVTPEREDLTGWEDATTISEAGRLARFVCSLCGGIWTESQRREMNRAAVLVHRGQEYRDGKVIGDHPDTYTLGFRWNAFNNLLWPTSYIAEGEWQAAQGTGDEEQLHANKTRLQYVWALPVQEEEVETEPLTVGIVRGSATGYAGRCNGLDRGVWPDDTIRRVGMIDVHKRNLRWQVMATRANGQRHIVAYGSFDTEQPDVIGEEVAISDAIQALCPMIQDAHSLDVGFVDCKNWTDTVQAAVKSSGSPWICSQGSPHFKMPERTTATRVRNRHADRWFIVKPKPGVSVISMDPDYWKKFVHTSLMIRPLDDQGQPKAGAITIYGSVPSDHTDWAKEVLAETWERRFVRGKGYKEAWIKNNKNNHSLDLLYGCLCADDLVEAAKEEGEPDANKKPQKNAEPSFVRDPSSGWMKRSLGGRS